jgi:SAM-dependent methyltransferase
MTVFGPYSKYYDLLYKDKDYQAESAFVSGLLRAHSPRLASILELGCGTGGHAFCLAKDGYSVHGVDVSQEMLAVARAKLATMSKDVQRNLGFSEGDACTWRSSSSFDVVISLFHVVSYQTTNDRLRRIFETAASHLRPGGLFIFDFWFAPAVLAERPATRVRRIESADIHVTRLAEPVMHIEQSCVDVNYEIFVRDKITERTSVLNECHRMRYLMPVEIAMLAELTGFSLVDMGEWMTWKKPALDTWSVCAVLRKSAH